jgi:hypothetical protein
MDVRMNPHESQVALTLVMLAERDEAATERTSVGIRDLFM